MRSIEIEGNHIIKSNEQKERGTISRKTSAMASEKVSPNSLLRYSILNKNFE